MQVRVRVELPDSPGALARLASLCGESYVNILSVRAYPGLATVTDDMILEVPDYWSSEDVRRLVMEAGGNGVAVIESSRADLDDEATRWLTAALAVLEAPSAIEDVIAHLLGPVGTPVAAEARRIDILRQFVLLARGNELYADLVRSAFGAGPDIAAATPRSLIARGVAAATGAAQASRRLIRPE